jgi:hypothetical protein
MNRMRNAALFAMPTGQFQMNCRVTAHTHRAPVTKPMTSITETLSPSMEKAGAWKNWIRSNTVGVAFLRRRLERSQA